MKKLLLPLLMFTILGCSADSESVQSDEGESTTEIAEETPKNWNYETQEDKMDGFKKYYAASTSTNKVEFSFPYEGGSTMNILVRNLSKDNDVLLTVSKGQFIPSFAGSESVRVKFDDNTASNYAYNISTDGSSDLIFIENSKKFLTNLKTAKKVMIEATFYQDGKQIFEFDTEGLEWSH